MRDGHRVTSVALSDTPADLSALTEADCVLLPIPTSGPDDMLYAPLYPAALPLDAVLTCLHPEQKVFGGRIPLTFRTQAAARGIILHDIASREEFAVANAVPTAEGAIQLAMEHLPCTVHRSKVLIAGFGRVGRCTAQRFRALGAQVSVCARSPSQLALAESMDLTPIPLPRLNAQETQWDLIVNTVPATLFTRPILEQTRALLLELASPPGGFDRGAVQELGLTLISAPGLPGKVAPVTAAQIIQKTVLQMLDELYGKG